MTKNFGAKWQSMFTKPNISSFPFRNEIFNKFYLYIFIHLCKIWHALNTLRVTLSPFNNNKKSHWNQFVNFKLPDVTQIKFCWVSIWFAAMCLVVDFLAIELNGVNESWIVWKGNEIDLISCCRLVWLTAREKLIERLINGATSAVSVSVERNDRKCSNCSFISC